MGKIYEHIDEKLAEWIKEQHVFFIATAPLAADGHVNCSPKGGHTFKILDPLTVVYQDYTGSGIETVAHLKENGRIVIMFCAFERTPRIIRLHGQGEVLEFGHPDYSKLIKLFPDNIGTRALIRVKLVRIADSCGMGVPVYNYNKERDDLDQWALKQGGQRLKEYRRQKNLKSIDALPGLNDTE